MFILQTEPAEQNNSKFLPVKIKIGFFSIVFNILSFPISLLVGRWHFLESRRASTACHSWLVATGRVPAGQSSRVCFLGRGGGVEYDYDKKKRNTASSGVPHIFDKIDARTFFWAEYAPNIVVYTVTLYRKEAYMTYWRKLCTLKKLILKRNKMIRIET